MAEGSAPMATAVGPREASRREATPRVGNQRTRGAGEEVGNPGGSLEANWLKTRATVIAVVLSAQGRY